MQLTWSERNWRVWREKVIEGWSNQNLTTLQGQVLTLHDHLENLETKVNTQVQYSKINCLVIHGIIENKDEGTDDLVLQTFNNEMINVIKLEQIGQTHRTSSLVKDSSNKNSWTMIVIIVRYTNRLNIFSNKKV